MQILAIKLTPSMLRDGNLERFEEIAGRYLDPQFMAEVRLDLKSHSIVRVRLVVNRATAKALAAAFETTQACRSII